MFSVSMNISEIVFFGAFCYLTPYPAFAKLFFIKLIVFKGGLPLAFILHIGLFLAFYFFKEKNRGKIWDWGMGGSNTLINHKIPKLAGFFLTFENLSLTAD